VSRYVVEKDSRSVVGVFKCPFCPCVFSSQADLDSHLAVFGRGGHVWKFRKSHSRSAFGVSGRVVFGYCFCGVKSGAKPKPVYEVVDSFILCSACRHFREKRTRELVRAYGLPA
jgi:hypothetical protein